MKALPIIVILAIAAGIASLIPLTGYNFFIIGLLTSACLWIVYVVCWDLLNGYTGMLNFGQLFFAGMAAYTVALIEIHSAMARPLAILIGLAVGTTSSLLLALPATRVRSAYFALVSFVLPLVFQRITLTYIKVFGGDYGLSIPRVFSREMIYYFAVGLMATTVIVLRLFVGSRIGMALQCIREDEETARAVGINVSKYKVLACAVSAFFTSMAGICGFYFMGHVGPEIFGMIGSFDVVIMGIVGGTGTIFGAALGAGVFTLLLEVMRPVAEFRNIIYAALLVIIVMMAPNGIWGGTTQLLARVHNRRSSTSLEST
jgi:branched-chain amino acid transport system permease protein